MDKQFTTDEILEDFEYEINSLIDFWVDDGYPEILDHPKIKALKDLLS